jgi:hypothetical protein
MAETLTQQARTLSSGTMVTLTGENRNTALAVIHAAFVTWCGRQPDQTQCWQDGWKALSGQGQPWPRPLATLALEIESAAQADQAQRTRERLELTLTQKQAPKKAQAEPVGLFAQTQQQLFDQ